LAVGEQHVQNKPQENLDPVKRPLRNSQDIINEYFSRSRQFLLTEKLVHDGIFRVEKTIILDGKKFHIGPVFKDIDGRLLSTMMVDSGNGKLYPRLLYQSDSGGGWMSTRGYALRMDKSGRIFKKGALSMKVSFQGRDYVYPAAYTETQVHSEIAEYLQTQRDASISYRGNFALDYFDLENPSVKETNTYSPIAEARERGAPEVGDTEVDFAVPESYIIRDSLGNEPQYMPAKLNMPGSENAGAYFKGLDHKFPQGFIPDFSVGPIRQPTIKYHTQLGKTISGIYRGYLNGKKVDWTMVYESPDNPRYEGRVWIENIRMTDSGLTTYGTYSNYLFTSILGHKPLDYSDQVSKLRMGIDRKTYSFDGNTGEPFYDDITPLLDNLLPIRLFRRARGIYRP